MAVDLGRILILSLVFLAAMSIEQIKSQEYTTNTKVGNDVLLDVPENLQNSQESRPRQALPRKASPRQTKFRQATPRQAIPRQAILRQVEKSNLSIYQKAQRYTKRRKLTAGAVDDLAQYSSKLEKAIHRKMAEMIGLETDSNLSNEDIAQLFLEKIDNGEITPAQLSTLQAYTTALQEAYIKRVIKVYKLKPEDLGLTPQYFCEVYEFCEFLTAETTGKLIDSTTETTTASTTEKTTTLTTGITKALTATTTLTTGTTTASTTETTTVPTTGIPKALTAKTTTTLTTGTTTDSTTETTTASTTGTTTVSTMTATTSTLPSTSSRTTLKTTSVSANNKKMEKDGMESGSPRTSDITSKALLCCLILTFSHFLFCL